LLLFLYQTLDAIDGKQARRTKSSTPLGQLFDHGCDAVCAALLGIFMPAALAYGVSYFSVLLFYIHLIPFFTCNWEEVHTHVMRFGVLGVTEAQFMIMLTLLANAIFGTQFWWAPIFGVRFNVIFLFLSACGVASVVFESFSVVKSYWRKEGIDPTIGLLQLAQFWLYLLLSGLWIVLSFESVFKSHHLAMFLTIGVTFSYLTTSLIVCSLTRQPYPLFTPILYPLPIALLNAISGGAFINEVHLAYCYMTYVFVVYGHYVVSVIDEICSFLNIKCFTISSP